MLKKRKRKGNKKKEIKEKKWTEGPECKYQTMKSQVKFKHNNSKYNPPNLQLVIIKFKIQMLLLRMIKKIALKIKMDYKKIIIQFKRKNKKKNKNNSNIMMKNNPKYMKKKMQNKAKIKKTKRIK